MEILCPSGAGNPDMMQYQVDLWAARCRLCRSHLMLTPSNFTGILIFTGIFDLTKQIHQSLIATKSGMGT